MIPASPGSPSSSQNALYDRVFSDYRLHIALIALFSIILVFSKLGGTGLANYDDCYYAQKAKEIFQTGSWMTMHFNNGPTYDNPPFYMWLVALSYTVFGVSEYAAKFPSALMGVSTILLLYFFARYLFDPWMGFFSSVVLATTSFFTRYARHAMFDVTLSFFVCLAMFALALSLRKNSRYFLLWGLSVSIGVLTKSVLGLFPFVIAVLYLLTAKRWRTFFNGYFLAGCGVIVILGFSWYYHQYWTFGRVFLDAHFLRLIFRRGLLREPQPWYQHLSYLKILLQYYWPWLPLLVLGFVRFSKMAWRKDENALLVLLWFATILTIMSMMKTRVRWYIMPIFPAAAIMAGYVLHGFLRDRGKVIFTKVFLGFGIMAIILINATPLQISSQRERDVRVIAPYVKHFGDQDAEIIAFRRISHSFNNALLFYSDHMAYPVFQEYAEFSEAFVDSALVLCVLNTSELEGVVQNVPEVYVVRKTDELVLVSNRPVDVSEVKTW